MLGISVPSDNTAVVHNVSIMTGCVIPMMRKMENCAIINTAHDTMGEGYSMCLDGFQSALQTMLSC